MADSFRDVGPSSNRTPVTFATKIDGDEGCTAADTVIRTSEGALERIALGAGSEETNSAWAAAFPDIRIPIISAARPRVRADLIRMRSRLHRLESATSLPASPKSE